MSTNFISLHNNLILKLEQYYDEREARSIASIYFEDRFDIKHNYDKPVDESALAKFNKDILRFENLEPVQYITGKAWFYRSFFHVNSSVLIPRPETEELVEMVLKTKSYYVNPDILDIGTGSGCIAISIARKWDSANITAIDISEKALSVCHHNIELSKTENIRCVKTDFLDQSEWSLLGKYDIIISNPPYIKTDERSLVGKSTILHEPAIALFPSGNDHLIFYKKIINFYDSHLKPGGRIFCEINEYCSSEIGILLKNKDFEWVIHKDTQGKDRIIEIIGKSL